MREQSAGFYFKLTISTRASKFTFTRLVVFVWWKTTVTDSGRSYWIQTAFINLPGNPTAPVAPAIPANPVGPVGPVEPANPGKPLKPDVPVGPCDP